MSRLEFVEYLPYANSCKQGQSGGSHELRIYAPAGVCGKAADAVSSGDDRNAVVGASNKTTDDRLRVSIESKTTREVRWSVQFAE